MDLAPITSRRLAGRTRKFGSELVVTDTNGAAVVRTTLGSAAGSAYAVVYTAGGCWRIKDGSQSAVTGVESAPVLDLADNTVATLLEGEVVLAGGERLPWKLSGILRKRCRLGGDLWRAKPKGLRATRFRAQLSEEMLGRQDLALLAGIFSVLTHSALADRPSGGGFLDLDISGI